MFLQVLVRIANNYRVVWEISSVNGSNTRVKFYRCNMAVFPIFSIAAKPGV